MKEPQQQSDLATHPNRSVPKSAERRSPRAHFSDDYQLMIASLSAEIDNSGMQRIEIAAALGKPKAYLTKILRGNQAATLTELRDICRAAGIEFVPWVTSVDSLLSAENASTKKSD